MHLVRRLPQTAQRISITARCDDKCSQDVCEWRKRIVSWLCVCKYGIACVWAALGVLLMAYLTLLLSMRYVYRVGGLNDDVCFRSKFCASAFLQFPRAHCECFVLRFAEVFVWLSREDNTTDMAALITWRGWRIERGEGGVCCWPGLIFSAQAAYAMFYCCHFRSRL